MAFTRKEMGMGKRTSAKFTFLVAISSLFYISMGDQLWAQSFHRPSVIEIHSAASQRDLNRPWMRNHSSEREAILALFRELARSSKGEELIRKAQAKAQEDGSKLLDLIESGETSMLDTTLVRRFSRDNPEVMTFETRSKIYINRNHILRNAVLDLAHELTHFIYREAFNPYQKNFSAEQFVRNTVEGKGGEAEAYLVECQVLRELYPRYFNENSNCMRIVDSSGQLSREKAISKFYRVGQYVREYQKRMRQLRNSRESVPTVSAESSQFISSAWGLPYPVAALSEYELIMSRVCENDDKRLSLMLQSQRQQRAPASSYPGLSTIASTEEDRVQRMMSSHRQRCQGFLP